MSREVISQSERRARATLTDSDLAAEEVGQRLRLLGDYTRLQLATTLFRGLQIRYFTRAKNLVDDLWTFKGHPRFENFLTKASRPRRL